MWRSRFGVRRVPAKVRFLVGCSRYQQTAPARALGQRPPCRGFFIAPAQDGTLARKQSPWNHLINQLIYQLEPLYPDAAHFKPGFLRVATAPPERGTGGPGGGIIRMSRTLHPFFIGPLPAIVEKKLQRVR